MKPSEAIVYCDTPDALADLCGRLAGREWLALDTEFLRERTYFPQLCLLQIAAPGLTACIDPLALPDLAPLLEVLYDTRVTKVMHAARQDMEIFYHLRGELPRPVFDTQIAAPLLGHADQIGYAALVNAVLGVQLAKSHTRADWTRRPLPPKQLEYAADDVRYLAQMYPLLRENLAAHGRLGWLEEDFAALSDPVLYSNPPEEAWRRVRGSDRLNGAQLAVLQALAAWRERTARGEDRPRGWLLKDEALLDFARQMPASETDLAHMRSASDRLLQRHGAQLLDIIRDARAHPVQPLQAAERPQRPDPAQEVLVDLLMAVVRLRSIEQSLNPAVLGSRKDLEQMVMGASDSPLRHGWRRSMVGEELEAILRGERVLHVHDDRLRIESEPDRR